MQPRAVCVLVAVASLAGSAALGQVTTPTTQHPIAVPQISETMRIALLEQQVATLTAQVKALQQRADKALYIQTPSEGSCRYGGTMSPNDILERTRTYHAVIDRAQSDYPLGFQLPVIQCSSN